MPAKDTLMKIIQLDEEIATEREKFESFPQSEQEDVLVDYFGQMLEKHGENDTVEVGAIRVAEMILSQGSERAARCLGNGLGHANPDVRLLSGDALLHLAQDGLERIMPAVEDALEKGGLRAEEMPFLLTDVDHPDVPRVLERFLAMETPDVVASAIEALAEYGDSSCVPSLKRIVGDKRKISVEENDVEKDDYTIGQLAQDAIDMLEEA